MQIRISEQSLELFENGVLTLRYAISTGVKPPSCREHSLGTPTGLHQIADKIGDGQPLGMIFKGRVPVGHCFQDEAQVSENLVTSRIMRLRGLESGVNAGPGVDTYDRYIYIHGTNHEERIGQPQSAGCPVLRNADMVDLFDRVPEGSLVWIANAPECALAT